jgi:hypothetical protein
MSNIDADDWLYLNIRVSFMIGMLALGSALAFTLALMLLQDAAIAQGVFPPPGAPVGPGGAFERPDGPLWHAAKQYQTFANVSGLIGLVLVLWGGIADRYQDNILEVFA